MRRTYYAPVLYQSCDGEPPPGHDERREAPMAEANLISSAVIDSGPAYGALHAPVLDLDVPARLVPSTTEGHSHLYIDVPMPWFKYRVLLRVLAWCGIIEHNYYRHSVRRRATFVRKPGVKKEIRVDQA